MKLSPRYHGDAIIELAPREMTSLVVPQRRRLAATLATLDDAQWALDSRCSGWSVQDVVSHLVEVNQFWTWSVRCGLAGEPSTLLAHFDPVTSPERSVAKTRGMSPQEILAQFNHTNDELASALGDVSDWAQQAEAPPGHVAVSTAAHHALWDAWVHERDVMLPLGLQPHVDDEEVRACLHYVAALAPAFALSLDETCRGAFGLAGERPEVRLDVVIEHAVEVRDPGELPVTLTGDSVELLEMLSIRTPFIAEIPADQMWMFTGLATVFDN